MNNNSVFNLNRYGRVRWWNILGHIKRIYLIVKSVYWRAKYGFTRFDTYCLFSFIGDLIHDSLTYMNENRYGYPGDMTDEEWGQYLIDMATAFKLAVEEEDSVSDQLGEEWCDMIDKYGKDDDRTKEAWEKYRAQSDIHAKEMEIAKDKACEMLKERFFYLWD